MLKSLASCVKNTCSAAKKAGIKQSKDTHNYVLYICKKSIKNASNKYKYNTKNTY